MKSSIERAMEKLEFDIKIDAVQFSKMSEENQALIINSLTKKEQYENLKNFRMSPYDTVEWKDKP